MDHQMGLQSDPFRKVQQGEKTIESRLFDGKRRQISVGDTITFLLEPERIESVQGKVVNLLKYSSFAELIDEFPPEFFGHSTKEDVLREVYQFYSKEDEQKNGVLGIQFKLINSC